MCENRRAGYGTGKERAIANPVRQVVALMIVAAILFFVAGVLNGVYPGGRGWLDHWGLGWLTYVFGALNVLVAFWISRGSERGLVARIVLGAGFLAIVALLALSQPTLVSVVIYVVTGLIEVVILLEAIRIWRIGRSAEVNLETVFALDASLPVAPPARESVLRAAEPDEVSVRVPALLSARITWSIGLLSLALAGVLVADGVLAGFIPGGVEWGLYGKQSGWLVYVFALVALVVAARAVHGTALALRLLLATALIVVIERLFSWFGLGGTTPLGLALRILAAVIALLMAIVSAAGLRSAERARRATTRISLQHATGSR